MREALTTGRRDPPHVGIMELIHACDEAEADGDGKDDAGAPSAWRRCYPFHGSEGT
jgi:hypothetical protein